MATGAAANLGHGLGCAGARVVSRVGADSGDFRVGDRVAVLTAGTIGNRLHANKRHMHRLPHFFSFEIGAYPFFFARRRVALGPCGWFAV